MAKFKAHEMGLTLASKNWQGSHAAPFQAYCAKLARYRFDAKAGEVIHKECIHPKVHEVVRSQL